MFSSVLGIRLQLLIGKGIPTHASYGLMNAFRSLEVTTNVEEPGDGFQIKFSIGKDKHGEYSLLKHGVLDPDSRVIVGVWMGAKLEPLIDGFIYNHQISSGEEPGSATLTVSGRDVSVLMDLHEKDENYDRQSDSVTVKTILDRYIQNRILQSHFIAATPDAPNDTERIPGKHETDLHYLRRLAHRNGYIFYIEPMTLGANKAYWGPKDRAGSSQRALSYDLGPSTNVKTLRFMNDALGPIDTKGIFVEPVTKISSNIHPLPLSSLLIPPLSLSTSSPRRTQRLRCTANRRADEALIAAKAASLNASEPISAEGELDTARYGSVLRPRRTVGVRGASRLYSGDYFVESVTHRIERGIYTQSFKLSREGTDALSLTVRNV